MSRCPRSQPFWIGLAGNDEMGGAHVLESHGGDIVAAGFEVPPLENEFVRPSGGLECCLHLGAFLPIGVALGIDHDGVRRARHAGGQDDDRRYDRQPDQAGLEAFRQRGGSLYCRLDAARVVAVDENGLLAHCGAP